MIAAGFRIEPAGMPDGPPCRAPMEARGSLFCSAIRGRKNMFVCIFRASRLSDAAGERPPPQTPRPIRPFPHFPADAAGIDAHNDHLYIITAGTVTL